MTSIEVITASEYGIMFLHDPESDPKVPEDAGDELIKSNKSCIAFCVLHYVDGDCKISIISTPKIPKLETYFEGIIECTSKKIALSDHNGFIFASVPIKNKFAEICIRMSDCKNPDIVECIVKNMEKF